MIECVVGLYEHLVDLVVIRRLSIRLLGDQDTVVLWDHNWREATGFSMNQLSKGPRQGESGGLEGTWPKDWQGR